MKMAGVLVEKVPKTYFVGVAWTLFTPPKRYHFR